jgi:hypothetical protein
MEPTIVHIIESCPMQLVLQTPAGQRVRVLIRTTKGEVTELEILD